MDESVLVLSAGAIGSTLILRKVDIEAGNEIFFDPFVSVGGYLKDIKFNSEVQMGALVIGRNFVLSPHFSSSIKGNIDVNGVSDKDILSIMVKTQMNVEVMWIGKEMLLNIIQLMILDTCQKESLLLALF